MKHHEYFLEQAIQLSMDNVQINAGGPFGAVIVLNDTVIAEGVNAVTATNDPTAHAEINAIRDACIKLKTFQLADCTLYSSCEPCPMCLGAIYWAHIKEVYYACSKLDAAKAGFDDSFIYEEIAMIGPARTIQFTQIKSQDACYTFELWEQNKEKIPY